jgi:ABC-2 type transport system ATP-binding protein
MGRRCETKDMPMIEARGLSKDYGAIRALRGVSFEIGASEVVGLLGPNGAGKTTLMKILTGYLHPTEGEATIEGIDVVADPQAVQARIGYLPESAPVYREMVVQEYLQMIAELRAVGLDQQRALISAAVRRTGLTDYLIRPIGELSKGYRQRVGLAQAMLHQPKVLILDEPTSGLDPSQIAEIRQLIKKLAKQSTVLLSTHILSEVELSCERVLIITEGEVRSDARLSELRAASTAAIAAVDGPPAEVTAALQAIPGVQRVIPQAPSDGFAQYRVVGGETNVLCPMIYDVVRERGWRLAELRRQQQTLESVFRSITEGAREAA